VTFMQGWEHWQRSYGKLVSFWISSQRPGGIPGASQMSLNTCVLATESVVKCSTPIPGGVILIKFTLMPLLIELMR